MLGVMPRPILPPRHPMNSMHCRYRGFFPPPTFYPPPFGALPTNPFFYGRPQHLFRYARQPIYPPAFLNNFIFQCQGRPPNRHPRGLSRQSRQYRQRSQQPSHTQVQPNRVASQQSENHAHYPLLDKSRTPTPVPKHESGIDVTFQGPEPQLEPIADFPKGEGDSKLGKKFEKKLNPFLQDQPQQTSQTQVQQDKASPQQSPNPAHCTSLDRSRAVTPDPKHKSDIHVASQGPEPHVEPLQDFPQLGKKVEKKFDETAIVEDIERNNMQISIRKRREPATKKVEFAHVRKPLCVHYGRQPPRDNFYGCFFPPPTFYPPPFGALPTNPFFYGRPQHLFRYARQPIHPQALLNNFIFQCQGRPPNRHLRGLSRQSHQYRQRSQQPSHTQVQPNRVASQQSENHAHYPLLDKSRAPTPVPKHESGIDVASQGPEPQVEPIADFPIGEWDSESGKEFQKKLNPFLQDQPQKTSQTQVQQNRASPQQSPNPAHCTSLDRSRAPTPVPKHESDINVACEGPEPHVEPLQDFPQLGKKVGKKFDETDIVEDIERNNMQINIRKRREPATKKIEFAHVRKPLCVYYGRQPPRDNFYGCFFPPPTFYPPPFGALPRNPFFYGRPQYLFRYARQPIYPPAFLNSFIFQCQGRPPNSHPRVSSRQSHRYRQRSRQTSHTQVQPNRVVSQQSENPAHHPLLDKSRAPTPIPEQENGIAVASQGAKPQVEPLPDFAIGECDPELGKKFEKKFDPCLQDQCQQTSQTHVQPKGTAASHQSQNPAHRPPLDRSRATTPVPKHESCIDVATQGPEPFMEPLPDLPIGEWDPKLGKKFEKKFDPCLQDQCLSQQTSQTQVQPNRAAASQQSQNPAHHPLLDQPRAPTPVPEHESGIDVASQGPEPQVEPLPDFPVGEGDPELGKKFEKKFDPNDNIVGGFERNIQINIQERREPSLPKIEFVHEPKPLPVDYCRQPANDNVFEGKVPKRECHECYTYRIKAHELSNKKYDGSKAQAPESGIHSLDTPCPHFFWHDEETLRLLDGVQYNSDYEEATKRVANQISQLGDPTQYPVGDIHSAILMESQGETVRSLDWLGQVWSWGNNPLDDQPRDRTENLNCLRACLFDSSFGVGTP